MILKNFTIANASRNVETDGSTSIQTDLETVNISPITWKGKACFKLDRKLANGSQKTSYVSKRYRTVLDTYLYNGFLSSAAFDAMKSDINNIKLYVDGGFSVNFNTAATSPLCNTTVLDITDSNGGYNYDKDFKVVRNRFGEFTRTISVNNSYNKSRAVKVWIGIYRNTSKSHLVDYSSGNFGFVSDRIKHLTSNTEKLTEAFTSMYGSLDGVSGADASVAIMENTSVPQTVLDKYLSTVNAYLNKKLTDKTVKDDKNRINDVNFMKKMFNEFVPQVHNLLDFQNCISFFRTIIDKNDRVFNRFVVFLAIVLENHFKKVYTLSKKA